MKIKASYIEFEVLIKEETMKNKEIKFSKKFLFKYYIYYMPKFKNAEELHKKYRKEMYKKGFGIDEKEQKTFDELTFVITTRNPNLSEKEQGETYEKCLNAYINLIKDMMSSNNIEY